MRVRSTPAVAPAPEVDRTLNLTVFETGTAADRRFRITCPFHHSPPLLFRGTDCDLVELSAMEHVSLEHKPWRVLRIEYA